MNGKPTILLRSGWQTVNIGDIAHSPGAIQFLNEHVPEAHVILWTNTLDRGARELMNRHLPDLEIRERPNEQDVSELIERSDLFLAGSGSRYPARGQTAIWLAQTGKPHGLLGVTVDEVTDETRPLLDSAAFCYMRETMSVQVLKSSGVRSPVIEFGPDATWAMTIRDDPAAARRREEHQLTEKQFICVVPRQRYTPYHEIRENHGWSKDKIEQVVSHNGRYTESDAAKLRDVIIRWVRETDHRVLLCPEMTYQLDLLKPYLHEPLPDDVKPNVSCMQEFWLPDEAASLYASACAVVSCECHSPIISIVNGTPAFYVRQPEDTIKGQMYRDLKLADWLFEIDDTSGEQIADRLMATFTSEQETSESLDNAMKIANDRFADAGRTIHRTLGLSDGDQIS